jgi:hypothetical protein
MNEQAGRVKGVAYLYFPAAAMVSFSLSPVEPTGRALVVIGP